MGNSQAGSRSGVGQRCAQRIPVTWIAAADIFISMVLTPKLCLLLTDLLGIYKPLWLIFGSAEAGLLGPDLRHGLLLAACWLASATFARLFDPEVTGHASVTEFSPIWWRLFVTFFINAWLLFFAVSFMGLFQPFNQADVLRMGIDKDIFGPSGLNIDIKVLRQLIDLNVDIVLQGILLGSWRLFCAGVDVLALGKNWSRACTVGNVSWQLGKAPWHRIARSSGGGAGGNARAVRCQAEDGGVPHGRRAVPEKVWQVQPSAGCGLAAFWGLEFPSCPAASAGQKDNRQAEAGHHLPSAAELSRLAACQALETGLYPKDLEKYTRPSAFNPAPVTLPPPFPGLARRLVAGHAFACHRLPKFCQA
eukprot:Skav200378  [mRNA]  locus=scaffold2518:374232:377599:- [translate_table: standard]